MSFIKKEINRVAVLLTVRSLVNRKGAEKFSVEDMQHILIKYQNLFKKITDLFVMMTQIVNNISFKLMC